MAGVLTFGNRKRTLAHIIGLQVRTIRKKIRSIRVNPGFNPRVSGFTPTPENESEFEQNFDLICDGLTQVTNQLVKPSFNTRVLQKQH